ncbi:hypothetical protein KGA66_16425, partial [Actinocrinis puniceicyclus]|nr:hypothetical protein [Actinocrinis puniceicyclus]
RSVGLTAGASAPPKLVDEVADALAGLGPVRREDPPGVEESYKFALPPMPPLSAARRSGDGRRPPATARASDTEPDLGSEAVDGAVVAASTGPDASAVSDAITGS